MCITYKEGKAAVILSLSLPLQRVLQPNGTPFRPNFRVCPANSFKAEGVLDMMSVRLLPNQYDLKAWIHQASSSVEEKDL